MGADFWTDDKVKGLRDLARESGFSASMIAAELGCSRNAVIGKAIRLGIALPGAARPKSRKFAPQASGSNPQPVRTPTTRRPRPAPEKPVPAPVVIPQPPTGKPLPFLAAVEAGRCLFFVGEAYGPDGPDMPVCGGERAGEGRYCAFHRHAGADTNHPLARLRVPA